MDQELAQRSSLLPELRGPLWVHVQPQHPHELESFPRGKLSKTMQGTAITCPVNVRVIKVVLEHWFRHANTVHMTPSVAFNTQYGV